MRPLSHWLHDANRLDELTYCESHPYPLLVRHDDAYRMQPPSDPMGLTMDRVVLASARRPEQPPSSIEDYVAIEVRRRISARSIHITVGCTEEADIQIADVSISKHHALFTQDRHGNWYVQDASSSTGTHVNDHDPSPTQLLLSGDRISFGMIDLVFYLPSQAYHLIRRLV